MGQFTTLSKVFSDDMLNKAIQISAEAKLRGDMPTAEQFKTQVVDPNIDEINKRTKQENDPLYLAYALEYCFNNAVPALPK